MVEPGVFVERLPVVRKGKVYAIEAQPFHPKDGEPGEIRWRPVIFERIAGTDHLLTYLESHDTAESAVDRGFEYVKKAQTL
jgi:hypothetical protein